MNSTNDEIMTEYCFYKTLIILEYELIVTLKLY